MRDIVLFLGAGFSYDADLPTMDRFGKDSNDEFQALQKHLKDDPRDAAPLLVEAGRIFKTFQNWCNKASYTSRNFNVDNMEHLFCLAEALQHSGQDPINLPDIGHYSIDLLVEKMQFWLWNIYKQFPPISDRFYESKESKTEHYKSFFKFINQTGIASKVSIITTNYDLVCEYFSWINKIPCCYPFNDTVSELAVIPGNSGNTFVSIKPNDNPLLIKIHGSINYFQEINKLQNNDVQLHVVTDVAEKGVWIRNSNMPTPCPSIFALEAIKEILDRYYKISPAIVAPSYAKLHRVSWLKTTWKAFIEAIRQAKVILFIGYSLPNTDGFIRSMFHAAMAMRNESDPMKLAVIDPGEVACSYHLLFTNIKETQYHKMTFEKAWEDNIIQTILNSTNYNRD